MGQNSQRQDQIRFKSTSQIRRGLQHLFNDKSMEVSKVGRGSPGTIYMKVSRDHEEFQYIGIGVPSTHNLRELASDVLDAFAKNYSF